MVTDFQYYSTDFLVVTWISTEQCITTEFGWQTRQRPLDTAMAKFRLFSKPNLAWTTPYWSHCPKADRKFRNASQFISARRILFISSLICFFTIVCARLAFPLLPLMQFGFLAIQIPGLVVAIFAMLWINHIVRERVAFHDDLILVQSGNRAYKIPMESLYSAMITVFDDDRMRLRIKYASRGRTRTTTFGLDRNTDLKDLQKAIPIPLSVRDARNRYRAWRRTTAMDFSR